jgi:cysteine-rich repeat protein
MCKHGQSNCQGRVGCMWCRITRALYTSAGLLGLTFGLLLATAALPTAVYAQATGCQASGSLSLFPTAGTTCAAPLKVNDTKDITVTVTNTCTQVPSFTPVQCNLQGVITYKLACTDTTCVTELPNHIQFVPFGTDGCVNAAVAGTTCAVDGGNSNHVIITVPSPGLDLAAAAAFVSVATIRVQAITPVTTVATSCPGAGQFGERADTAADGLSTNSPSCESVSTGNAGGSTNEFFPPICGDGIVGNTSGEQCDDGNNVDHDGCSATCQNETCAVQVDKEVSCNGTDWYDAAGLETDNGDGTHGPGADAIPGCPVGGAVYVRYQVRNNGDVPVNNCALAESSSTIKPGNVVTVDSEISYMTTLPFTPVDSDQTCASAGLLSGEPDTATLTCDCVAPSFPSPQTATAYDTATVSCEASCGDGVIDTPGATCDPGNGSTIPAVFQDGAPEGHGPCYPATAGANACHFCGDDGGVLQTGEACDDGNADPRDGCDTTNVLGYGLCQPVKCNVQVDKQISCDNGTTWYDQGLQTADGDTPLGPTNCDPSAPVLVKYQAANVGDLDATCTLHESNTTISTDPVASGVTIAYNDTVDITTNLDPPLCRDAQGQEADTATLDCTCAAPSLPSSLTASAYDKADASCTEIRIGCRMTGGKNNGVGAIDAEVGGGGLPGPFYTVGGQVGAPGSSGCLEVPPKGQCKQGICQGGPQDGLACNPDGSCPSYDKTNAPWGEWEHVHHAGPDDDNNITDGMFSFHAGSHSAPDEAYIKDVACTDPGWCVQARPANNKQIYWEGLGVFQNLKSPKGSDIRLPDFPDCSVVPWNPNSNAKKLQPTLHYYKAHVGDFGEPAGDFQKPIAGCSEPGGFAGDPWEFASCNQVTGDNVLDDVVKDDAKSAEHPLCEAQACSESDGGTGCPDWYDIEIHCTADPASHVIYHVGHFLDEGNFQLHPPVGDSCNPDDTIPTT